MRVKVARLIPVCLLTSARVIFLFSLNDLLSSCWTRSTLIMGLSVIEMSLHCSKGLIKDAKRS